MTNERMIKVTGKGNLKIKPDMTRITITLEGQNKEYDKTLAQFSRDTEALKDIHPDFRLSYTVKDPEASKNQLLGKAVADAKAKAEALTKAAGVSLKDIKNIDYSWGEIQFEYAPMTIDMFCNKVMAPGAEAFDMDTEPDDISVSYTVTVVWEID